MELMKLLKQQKIYKENYLKGKAKLKKLKIGENDRDIVITNNSEEVVNYYNLYPYYD